MPTGDNVDIPANILVRCPLVKFAMARATKCNTCTHFCGLSEQMARPGLPFFRTYAVRCNYPVDRELAALED